MVIKMNVTAAVLAILFTLAKCQAQEENKICSLRPEDDRDLLNSIFDFAKGCLLQGTSRLPDVTQLKTLDEFRNWTSPFCEQQPRYHECFEEAANATFGSCQAEVRHQISLSYISLLDSLLSIACLNKGERLTTLLLGHHLLLRDDVHGTLLGKCVYRSASRIRTLSTIWNWESAAKLFILYNEVKLLWECLNIHNYTIESFPSIIADDMECISPNGNTQVRCNSVLINETQSPFCPIKREDNANDTTIKHTILSNIKKCLKEDNNTVAEGRDLKWYRNYYHHKCQNMEAVRKCINTASLISWPCLKQKDAELVHLVSESLLTALETGCLNDGEPLAYIFANNEREGNSSTSTENGTYIERCLFQEGQDRVQTTEGEQTNATMLEFYRDLTLVRDCFIREQQGDNMAIFYTQLLFNEVLADRMCNKPNYGEKYIPCEDIVPTGGKNCQFNGTERSEESLYLDFVEMGYNCSGLIEGNFEERYQTSTLDEVRSFVVGHCRIRRVKERCFGTMVNNSRACLSGGFQHRYGLFMKLMTPFVTSGCQGDMENMVAYIYATNRYKEEFVTCKLAMDERLQTETQLTDSDSVSSMEVFKAFGAFSRCFSDSIQAEGQAEVKANTAAFMRQIVMDLSCVNDDGNTVTCASIANPVNGNSH